MATSIARPRRRLLPAMLMLLAAGTSQGCFTMRPWRACPQPCAGAQLQRAQQVRVYTYAPAMFVLTHTIAGKDQHGAFLFGEGRTGTGTSLGRVRIYIDEICAIRTRRLEGTRVAANAVVVPIVVAGVVLAAYYGGDVGNFGELWPEPQTPTEAWPDQCPEPPAAAAPPP